MERTQRWFERTYTREEWEEDLKKHLQVSESVRKFLTEGEWTLNSEAETFLRVLPCAVCGHPEGGSAPHLCKEWFPGVGYRDRPQADSDYEVRPYYFARCTRMPISSIVRVPLSTMASEERVTGIVGPAPPVAPVAPPIAPVAPGAPCAPVEAQRGRIWTRRAEELSGKGPSGEPGCYFCGRLCLCPSNGYGLVPTK